MSIEVTEKTLEFQSKFNIFSFDIAKQIIEYFETDKRSREEAIAESYNEGLEDGRIATL